MSTLKIGDRVRVTPGATARAGRFVGRAVTVASIHGVGVMAKDPDGGVFGLYHGEYELIPTASILAPGVRVRTTQDSRPSWLRGKEGMVTEWGEDAEPDARYVPVVIDCDPDDVWYFEPDELELAPEPKREPKAGEVWRMDSGTLLLIGRYGGFFNLNRLTAYTVPSATTEYSVREGDLTFAAGSLKDAAALGLL